MSWWDTAASWYSDSGSSSSGNGNIWGAIISGIGSAAGGYMSGKAAEGSSQDNEKLVGLKGIEDRKSLAFAGQLEDFYKQKEKQRKRASLNSYGQYNLMGKIMPTSTPPVDVPAQPTV